MVHENKKTEVYGGKRRSIVEEVKQGGGVVVTTYGMVRGGKEGENLLERVNWDFVILDEGHTIKNPTNKVPPPPPQSSWFNAFSFL